MWHCLSFTVKVNNDSGFKHSWSIVCYSQEDLILKIILHLGLFHKLIDAGILQALWESLQTEGLTECQNSSWGFNNANSLESSSCHAESFSEVWWLWNRFTCLKRKSLNSFHTSYQIKFSQCSALHKTTIAIPLQSCPCFLSSWPCLPLDVWNTY